MTLGSAEQIQCLCLCGLPSGACPGTSENKGETAWELIEAFRAPGREEEEEEKQSGGKTTPHKVGTLL